MSERTFGWVQEAYTISNLKNVILLFVHDSKVNRELRENKIPRLISEEYGQKNFIEELDKKQIIIPYTHLKGKGTPKGYSRSNAPCSGIVQAVLPGQRKEYQSDWPADSFLRWAVSIGFLNYDREEDACSLTEAGEKYACAKVGSDEEKKVLTEAFMSYPPVCRILSLLDENQHMTKFEIGEQLGFVGEAGFTSIPQHMIIRGLSETRTTEERTKLLQDTEGTSDKYVRTICSWLQQMDWVVQEPKEISIFIGDKEYSDKIRQSYRLTLLGRSVLKHSLGKSKFSKVPKRVMWDMLATKITDRDYIRNRRTLIIKYIQNIYRSKEEIVKFLKSKGIDETEETISDDLIGFKNIGLNIQKNVCRYKLTDKIIGLEIPQEKSEYAYKKSEILVEKDFVRERLKNINHKYLLLLDLGLDGKSDRDYEIQTAELLTTELDFEGARLGDARKPDVCVYYKDKGLIIDNKAYSKGYSLPIKQADEMYRYIEENKLRDKNINPNEWWEIYDVGVTSFKFAFVSGMFTGGFKDRLKNISMRSGVNGAAINSINLLLLAEEIKAGRIKYEESFDLFDSNDEIVLLSNDTIPLIAEEYNYNE